MRARNPGASWVHRLSFPRSASWPAQTNYRFEAGGMTRRRVRTKVLLAQVGERSASLARRDPFTTARDSLEPFDHHLRRPVGQSPRCLRNELHSLDVALEVPHHRPEE